MSHTKLNEIYISNKHKNPILLMYLLVSEFPFLEFRLLLSRVAPYLKFIITNCLITCTGICSILSCHLSIILFFWKKIYSFEKNCYHSSQCCPLHPSEVYICICADPSLTQVYLGFVTCLDVGHSLCQNLDMSFHIDAQIADTFLRAAK